MKRIVAVALVTALLAVSVAASPALAVPDQYDDTQSHPLRVAAYLAHPIGYAAEWLIFRPFHYLVSRPSLERMFGHNVHGENRVY
jgi:hypothetical protein